MAIQAITAHAGKTRAAALDPQRFKWINDEFRVIDLHQGLDRALAAYQGVGCEQPTYAKLGKLHAKVRALCGELLESATYGGQPDDARAIKYALESAHDELADEKHKFDGGMRVDLQQLNQLCRGARSADLATTLRALPALNAALDDYRDQLREASGPGQQMSERAIHERNRCAVNQAAHQALLQQLAQKTRTLWHSDANIYQLLDIGRDYRSSPVDAVEFEQAFLQGRLVRTGGTYASPKECLDLYRDYGAQLRRAQREGELPKDMPLAELIAIRTYTVNSDELKDAMIAGDTGTMRALAPLVKLALSGLNHIAESRENRLIPRTIFRGVKLTADELLERGYVAGNKMVIPSFASCTTGTATQYTVSAIFTTPSIADFRHSESGLHQIKESRTCMKNPNRRYGRIGCANGPRPGCRSARGAR